MYYYVTCSTIKQLVPCHFTITYKFLKKVYNVYRSKQQCSQVSYKDTFNMLFDITDQKVKLLTFIILLKIGPDIINLEYSRLYGYKNMII